jgi:hypothetical protein
MSFNPIRDFAVAVGAVAPKLDSPLTIAVAELEQAQRNSLRAEAEAEKATMTAAMLVERIDRLRRTVHSLMQEANHAKA